jgi:hypothetical protein
MTPVEVKLRIFEERWVAGNGASNKAWLIEQIAIAMGADQDAM